MHIQINTDGNIEGHEALATQVSSEVESALKHVSDHITRVEVHLSDENSDKKGGNDDMRCVMEARPRVLSINRVNLSAAPSTAWSKVAA